MRAYAAADGTGPETLSARDDNGLADGNRQAKPVYEQCPDKGTCHHACILGTGACFRVLHAGPLSGRYEDDKWPAGH